MVDLPLTIYNGDAVSSLLGTMFFPGDHESAEKYASWWLGRAVAARASDDTLTSIPVAEIRSLLSRAGEFYRIAEAAGKAGFSGTTAGALASYMWHIHKSGASASWNDAVKAIEQLACKGVAGTRSSILQAKSDFAPVLHYWAIISIECENRFPDDYRLFISRSEMLLREMRALESSGAIAGDSFSAPKIFVPVSAFDWRVAGAIRVGAVPQRLAPISKGRAGRPRKIQVLR